METLGENVAGTARNVTRRFLHAGHGSRASEVRMILIVGVAAMAGNARGHAKAGARVRRFSACAGRQRRGLAWIALPPRGG